MDATDSGRVHALAGSFDATPEDSEDKNETKTPGESCESRDDYALGCLLPSHRLRIFATSLINKRCHVGSNVTLSFDSIILSVIAAVVLVRHCRSDYDDATGELFVVDDTLVGDDVCSRTVDPYAIYGTDEVALYNRGGTGQSDV